MATVETIRPRLTYADLERMPDDGRRYELYDGEVVVVPSPLPRHQIVHARLVELLRAYASARGGLCLYAPLDIVFSDYHVLQPDIVYFGPQRRSDAMWSERLHDEAAVDLAPETLAEQGRAFFG